MSEKKVWIIGAGDMAVQYSRILDTLGIEYKVIGRGERSALKYEAEYPHKVIRGGLEKYLRSGAAIPEYAIVAVYPTMLKKVTVELIEAGVKNILTEKPGGINWLEIEEIKEYSKRYAANVFVAYNRRFLASVIKAKEIISQDGGVTSFNFEFTEWGHVIRKYEKPREELENWFMANSTHVVDLAYYLGGIPCQISCYVAGKLDWHPKAECYAGAGITEKGALFSYKANWGSAGRWSVEILTRERKLLLEPMEQLKVQMKGGIKIESVELDDELDMDYKPGLFLQTKSFLEGNSENLADINLHSRLTKIYEAMETNGIFYVNDL